VRRGSRLQGAGLKEVFVGNDVINFELGKQGFFAVATPKRVAKFIELFDHDKKKASPSSSRSGSRPWAKSKSSCVWL